MTQTQRSTHLFTLLIAGLALLGMTAAYRQHPPTFDQTWWVVFGALFLVALSAQLLAVRISDRGTATTMDYIPELGAILLLGPFGAGLLAGLSWLVYMGLFTDKPATKTTFNASQFTLSVSAAGLIFLLLGGHPSLNTFNLTSTLVPFAGAVFTHFATNRITVGYVISISNDRTFRDVLQDLTYTPFLFDFAASSIALALAFMYVRWGAIALVAIIIPLIGLRYTYGVNLELKQLNTDLLRVLIKTIEAQDPYTSGHSIRVAEGAIALARHMGLSPHEINKVETAALLHDIGKIDSAYRKILTQKGPLTPEQTKLIKEHPERGVKLIKSVRSLDPDVLEFIKHHHERYDGTGYPDGLESGQIPVGARIIMVADAIDAMVTSRAYRDALSVETAQKELLENSGSQFDPEIVDAAIEIGLVSEHIQKAHGEGPTVREF